MNGKLRFRMGTLVLALATAGSMMWSAASYSQTQGMDRRDDRQDSRGEARDTKQECKDADGNRMDCRQEKRDVKQDARGPDSADDVEAEDLEPDE